MKKLLILTLCLLVLAAPTGCRGQKGPGAVRWFDIQRGDDLLLDEPRVYTDDRFPDTQFVTTYGSVEKVIDGEHILLYQGIPVWSVYFCDLNGDTSPELCSCVSFGSGIIDDRIVVYDVAADVKYELQDRGVFDYRLDLHDGLLVAERRIYGHEDRLDTGTLLLKDGTLTFQKSK